MQLATVDGKRDSHVFFPFNKNVFILIKYLGFLLLEEKGDMTIKCNAVNYMSEA